MIAQGIKNFFTSLKYFFTPLGTIALGFVIGLSVLLPGLSASVDTLVAEISRILSETQIDLTALKDSFTSALYALDWNDPMEAVKTMLSYDWLTATINGCIAALVESSEAFAVPINAAVAVFVTEIFTYIIVVVIFLLLGVIGGFFLTKWLVRRNVAKRALWKYFLHAFIDGVITATLVAFCFWLISVWKPSVFVTTLSSILLFGFIALFEAYVIHGWKKVKLIKIVNCKNILLLFLTDMIVFVLAAALGYIAVALTNQIVGAFIGVAVFEIAFVVIGLNAEAYVKSIAQKAVPLWESAEGLLSASDQS